MKKAFILFSFFLLICFASAPVSAQKNTSLSGYFSEKNFNTFFPLRDKFYTYKAFIQAYQELSKSAIKIEKHGNWIYKISITDKKLKTSKIIRLDTDWNADWAQALPYACVELDYANFCSGMDINTNKKELAAFFAHIAHETRNGMDGKYNDGLMLKQEIHTDSAYITKNVIYPAVAGKKYFGRGPLQISYNGNYGFASDCIFGNKNILLNNPDLITSNAVVAFKTAIYFWMTPQSLKPSAHEVMLGKWQPNNDDKVKGRKPGFGMTINIINGALECNKGENQVAMNNRINFYRHFLKLLNTTDANCACSCGAMAAIQ